MAGGTDWLTAAEAAERYHVETWTIVKAARQAGVETQYCRRRWRRLYPAGDALRAAIDRYSPVRYGGARAAEESPANKALDALIRALGISGPPASSSIIEHK